MGYIVASDCIIQSALCKYNALWRSIKQPPSPTQFPHRKGKNKVKKSRLYTIGSAKNKIYHKNVCLFVCFLKKFRKIPVIATRRQLAVADMASTQVLFAVSNLVTFRGHTCISLEIRRKHGFHTYQLRDLDTGVIVWAFRCELKPADATPLLVDLSDDVWGLDDVRQGEPGMQGNTAEQGRFATVSTEELDGLASKRMSQTTKGQSKWTVQIFKGKHVAMFIFTFRWCRHWWVKGH